MWSWYKLVIYRVDGNKSNYYLKTVRGIGKKEIRGIYENPGLGKNVLIEGENWYSGVDGSIEVNFRSSILIKNPIENKEEELNISGNGFMGYVVDAPIIGRQINTSSVIICKTTDAPDYE